MFKKLRETFSKPQPDATPSVDPQEDIPPSSLVNEAVAKAQTPKTALQSQPFRLGPTLPTLSEQESSFESAVDFDALHTSMRNDLFAISHNFTMLVKLMQQESSKLPGGQRYIEFTEDASTGRENKRYDFLLKTHELYFPAYVCRYKRKIVYGLMAESLDDPTVYAQTIPALVSVALADIETLTQMIQKTAPPFEIVPAYKDADLINFLEKQFTLT